MQTVIAGVVDLFLASRRGGALPSPTQACGKCSGACNCPVAASSASEQAGVVGVPTPPPVTISDFVCEADVREAMRENRKIYIGPRSIVTPSARDLAGSSDTLVVAERANG